MTKSSADECNTESANRQGTVATPSQLIVSGLHVFHGVSSLAAFRRMLHQCTESVEAFPPDQLRLGSEHLPREVSAQTSRSGLLRWSSSPNTSALRIIKNNHVRGPLLHPSPARCMDRLKSSHDPRHSLKEQQFHSTNVLRDTRNWHIDTLL